MRRKELGDGRNIGRRNRGLPRHDLVFLLRDVELVEPAQHLYLGTILIRNLAPESLHHGVLRQQIVRQQQFRLVVQPLKQVRQQGVIEPAGGQNQMTIDLALRVIRRNAAIEQPIQPVEGRVPLEFLRAVAPNARA